MKSAVDPERMQSTPPSVLVPDPGSHKDSRSSVEHDETSPVQESQVTDSILTEWTDEKHSLYLKSMETSFVNQLYKSLDLVGQSSVKEYSSRSRCINSPPHQFKVFQDGSWGKIKLSSDEPQFNKTDESGALSANPWIRRYRSTKQIKAHPALLKKGPRATSHFPTSQFSLSRGHSSYCHTEMTDQNFIDENEEENSSRVRAGKRFKASVVGGSTNDQVVPLCEISSEEVADNCLAVRED